MHRLQELVRLHREGCCGRQVARLLVMSPNTERKYREALKAEGLLYADDELPELDVLRQAVDRQVQLASAPEQEISSVEPWRKDIMGKVKNGAGPTAIYDYLRTENEDFKGSLSAIKRMVHRIRQAEGPSAESVVLHVETLPGEVAQVDFGSVGKLFDPDTGKVRTAYVFVMVLNHSRLMYASLVFDQRVNTWIDEHEKAFEFFGGVPRVVVPDNLKSAVLTCYYGGKSPELNRTYREMARHYGFKIDPTPPRSPQLKGRVESGVGYVKKNFFGPREIETIADGNAQLGRWLENVANVRIHGTTRQPPVTLFEQEEVDALLPLPRERYVRIIWKQCTVHPDSHIHFEKRLYSVPFKHMGQKVWVRAQDNSLIVWANDVRVATHVRRGPRYQTNDAHLPECRRDYRHQSRSWWENKARCISETLGDFIVEIFESDDVYHQLRTVQAIVTYVEPYPVERINAACERARLYGNYTYPGIRNILREGLDMALVYETPFVHGRLENPRFARSVDEIMGEEVSHERA